MTRRDNRSNSEIGMPNGRFRPTRIRFRKRDLRPNRKGFGGTSVLLGAFLAVFLPACAGYRDMAAELESHVPPAPVLSGANADARRNRPSHPGIAEERARESAALREARKRWTDSLAAKSVDEEAADGDPIAVDPARMARLRPAADDAEIAAEVLRGTFSRADLEALALLRNPGIRAAAAEFRAVLAQFDKIERVDAVLAVYGAFTDSLMAGVGPMTGMDRDIRKRFPFPGVAALKGRAVEAGARAAREGLSAARQDAVAGVRKVFWNLHAVARARRIRTETLGLLDQLESVADSRYRAGAAGFQDVVRVTIRRKTLVEELNTLRERERNLEAGLFQILDLPPGTVAGAPRRERPDPSLPALETLLDLAMDHRPELRMLRARIDRMERMLEMGETMIRPSPGLDLSAYDHRPAARTGGGAMGPAFPEGTRASTGAGAPAGAFFGSRDAWLEESRFRLSAMRERLAAAEAMTAREVREAWFELDRALRETRLFGGTVVDLSRSAMEVSGRGYESGSVSFSDVIAAYAGWLDANLTWARKESDIGVARAELERLVGRRLPRGARESG